GLMALFFFVVALELKREFVLGELRSLRVAALPFAGVLGGMAVPVSVYLALMVGEPGAASGLPVHAAQSWSLLRKDAGGGIRTHKGRSPSGFKPLAYAVPPPRLHIETQGPFGSRA